MASATAGNNNNDRPLSPPDLASLPALAPKGFSLAPTGEDCESDAEAEGSGGVGDSRGTGPRDEQADPRSGGVARESTAKAAPPPAAERAAKAGMADGESDVDEGRLSDTVDEPPERARAAGGETAGGCGEWPGWRRRGIGMGEARGLAVAEEAQEDEDVLHGPASTGTGMLVASTLIAEPDRGGGAGGAK